MGSRPDQLVNISSEYMYSGTTASFSIKGRRILYTRLIHSIHFPNHFSFVLLEMKLNIFLAVVCLLGMSKLGALAADCDSCVQDCDANQPTNECYCSCPCTPNEACQKLEEQSPQWFRFYSMSFLFNNSNGKQISRRIQWLLIFYELLVAVWFWLVDDAAKFYIMEAHNYFGFITVSNQSIINNSLLSSSAGLAYGELYLLIHTLNAIVLCLLPCQYCSQLPFQSHSIIPPSLCWHCKFHGMCD